MRRALPWALAALGFICVGLGLWQGEWRVVFSRAAHICLTCIGIG
ncbi:MAG: CD1871A family CXXC motif-containing protein [Clostridia bacterium]|nr:CD1871A family CXXC motif-containing protein [Clostridia bacterium]